MNRYRERYNQLLQKESLTDAERLILIWCDQKATELELTVKQTIYTPKFPSYLHRDKW